MQYKYFFKNKILIRLHHFPQEPQEALWDCLLNRAARGSGLGSKFLTSFCSANRACEEREGRVNQVLLSIVSPSPEWRCILEMGEGERILYYLQPKCLNAASQVSIVKASLTSIPSSRLFVML